MVLDLISGTQLASVLSGSSDYLLIDCRSFLVFNKSRIRNAVNIRCNSILRRRSRGEMSLDNVIVVHFTNNTISSQGSPVQILPHLYLGSAHHAAQENELAALGITAVLNASSTCENHFANRFRYKRIPVEDNGQADISSWFDGAIAFINEEQRKGGKVFVHCLAGISRSATICIAYLITCKGVSLNDAFRYVKSRRNVISPNFNFMGQLSSLEAKL
uniref:Protein-serine/threonine phosphatase n=1 Tax=Ciona savignyi TaxID=51511 RepID=H2YEC9_CIOSA